MYSEVQLCILINKMLLEQFEDTKSIIRNWKSKDRQKNDKRQTMIHKIIHIKLNVEQQEPHVQPVVYTCTADG